jgi:putative colanic acid biosysnthesis UDP-glucose lipid carrier transferase
MIEEGDLSLAEAAGRVEGSWLKRLIDIAGAGGGLLFLAPILMFVAVLIRLESGGPSLFRQRRTGHAGTPFKIYKFRTMHVQEDGDTIKQAERKDERLTSVGAFLRRSSIDELPQLINVLKGDMSLVGPRPHAVAHDHFYASAIPHYNRRFMIRPGITGLAQVMGFRGATPDVPTMAARIEKDLQYIDQWSVGLDIAILVRTVLSLPFDPTAY